MDGSGICDVMNGSGICDVMNGSGISDVMNGSGIFDFAWWTCKLCDKPTAERGRGGILMYYIDRTVV